MPELVDGLGFSAVAVYVPLYDHYRKQRRWQRHFHDGCYWVRMPYEDFPRMFPDLPAVIVSKALGKPRMRACSEWSITAASAGM